MAEVKWIKIVTDIFDDDKILLIESLPEHDAIIVIWFKLLCLAGKMNNHGVFIMNGRIAYTDEMFATIFRRPLNTVRLALDTFEKFGMIERIDNVVTIPNWSKHQTLDQLEERKKYMRTYMQKYREKQKLLIEEKDGKECKVNSKVNSKANVNSLDKDIDIEEDIERDKEKDNKDNKINLINDKSDKALRVDCHPLTLELIKRNYITEHDLDIPSYNVLFDAMSNNYPKEQLYTTLSYIVSKSRGKQIDNKYAYFETALIKGLNRKKLEYKANGEVEVY